MQPADLIAGARARAGLTQAELAHRAGTSQPVISAYERGHRDPTFATLRRLIEAAGARLTVDAARGQASDLATPADLHEHARRLIAVLSLTDAVPKRRRSARLDMPRLVSV